MKKILHIGACDPILNSYIIFVKNNFKFSEHEFLLITDENKGPAEYNNIHISSRAFFSRAKHYILLIIKIHKARKVILHGISDPRLVLILFFMPWVLSKCHWVIWGGDLYSYKLSGNDYRRKLNEIFRRGVIKRFGYFITYIRGDYDLACKWYSAKGVLYECFMYPSNLYQEEPMQDTLHDGINILLGNSADPSNNHMDVLDKLRPFAAENIYIYCPLSYGDSEYAKKVTVCAKSIFGHKFIPLLDFMVFDDYMKILSKIDIAVFNHKRQQGMGNTISLLGMGKKVFMRDDVTPYAMFTELGVKAYPISDLNLSLICKDIATSNKRVVSQYFSKSKLKDQWALICE